jgi:hypothetical protein
MHVFDKHVASLVGLNAAVIHQNLLWWCEKNAANERNIHNGRAWTYNSSKAFEEIFWYLTASQIRLALKKLEDTGLILSGNFNDKPYDRTKWYAAIPICEIEHFHLTENTNGFERNNRPIPDINPDITTDKTPIPPKGDLFSAKNQTEENTTTVGQGEEQNHQEQPSPSTTSVESTRARAIEAGFAEFWAQWPSHPRKSGKADCRKVYTQQCLGKFPKADQIEPDQMNAAARAYVASLKGDLTYLKGPLPWLRVPGWEPFVGKEQFSEDDLSPSQRAQLADGHVPPSMMVDGEPSAAARYWLKRYGHGGKS